MEMKTLEITTESGTYLVVELPDSARVLWVRENFIRIEYTLEGWNCPVEQNVLIPPAKWSKIGLGKDHPKLVGELGLLQDNPYGQEQPPMFDGNLTESTTYKMWCIAQKRVFKNQVILRKNDPN